jgi:ABC-type sugar transport system permease subunit
LTFIPIRRAASAYAIVILALSLAATVLYLKLLGERRATKDKP